MTANTAQRTVREAQVEALICGRALNVRRRNGSCGGLYSSSPDPKVPEDPPAGAQLTEIGMWQPVPKALHGRFLQIWRWANADAGGRSLRKGASGTSGTPTLTPDFAKFGATRDSSGPGDGSRYPAHWAQGSTGQSNRVHCAVKRGRCVQFIAVVAGGCDHRTQRAVSNAVTCSASQRKRCGSWGGRGGLGLTLIRLSPVGP